jgi:D-alanyl-lipoteichoic acid acyltransferase DltB (MBOAT superfamily)
MVLADRIAVLVDTVYDPMLSYQFEGFTVFIAAVLFSIQIYCDFAGYTHIAIGAAKIMGFTLKDNFNTPYLAVSIKDFWDRWHISLTSWFRDYLYFPLGGSRKGVFRKHVNIMIVFTLSGLWHGASWHYVAWGLLHGVMRVVGELTQKARAKMWAFLKVRTEVLSFKVWQMLVTFVLVTIAWVFFRAESTRQAVDVIVSMFTQWNPWVFLDGSLLGLGLDGKDWIVLLTAIVFLIIVECFYYSKVALVQIFAKQNVLFQMLVFYLGIIAVVLFGVYGPIYDATQFIYFQF